jgi:hypothetical protein
MITESDKTAEDHAEDIAYTINHALACTATDALEPYLDNWFQEKLGIRFPLGCGRDHDKEPHHEHGAHCQHHESNLWRWYAGELIGDFGAIPITIAAQHYAPSFMNGVRHVIEPVLGPVFAMGAKWSARSWAKQNGFATDSKECREKQEQIYAHEVSHLPQALLWTASSITLNLCTQKLLGNKAPLWQMGGAKALGATLNTALVVSGRAMAPQTARRWDRFTTRHVFLPATKTVGKIFGIDETTIDRMAEKDDSNRWAKRVNPVNRQAAQDQGR